VEADDDDDDGNIEQPSDDTLKTEHDVMLYCSWRT